MEFLATSIVTPAAIGNLASANTCTFHDGSGGGRGIASSYFILTDGQVPDIPGVCGGLWDKLKHFADCIGVGSASCYSDAGRLHGDFTNGGNCNEAMVELAWWEAIKYQRVLLIAKRYRATIY